VREFAKQIIIKKKKKHKRKEKGNIFSILQSGPIKRYVFDHLGRLIFNFDFFSLKKKKFNSCLAFPLLGIARQRVASAFLSPRMELQVFLEERLQFLSDLNNRKRFAALS
jgi:hypothetical protein